MQKIFDLFINSQPKGRHVKWGEIIVIRSKNGIYSLKELFDKNLTLYDIYDDIDEVEMRIGEEPGRDSPFPNYISISLHLYGVDPIAESFLLNNQILFLTKPIKIVTNSDMHYKLVRFPDMLLLNVQKSNAEIVNGKAVTKGETYFSSFSSPIILNQNARNIHGIMRIAEVPNVLVCNEKVKKLLEKNKLTGFNLKQLEISEE